MDTRRHSLSDPDRLAALRAADLLDSPTEEAFDRLTRLATRILDVPVALISLVDEDRQFFKSCIGLPEPWATMRETPLSHSFCQHVVDEDAALVIADARDHPLVKDNLAIPDLGVVAYIGIPLRLGGQVIGTFCAIDSRPREWSAADVAIVRDLAAGVMTEIELRAIAARLREREAGFQAALAERETILAREKEARLLAQAMEATLATVIEHVPVGIFVTGASGQVLFVNQIGRAISGLVPGEERTLFEQVAGYTFREPEGGREVARDGLAVARALSGEMVRGMGISVQRPGEAEALHLRVDAMPLVAPDGEVSGVVSVLTDVTREREMERQQRDFLYAAAHDLKNPLTSIKGFAQILQRRLLREGALTAERSLDDIRRIDDTASRMTALITELLDTTRLQPGEMLDLDRRPTDLAALTRRVVQQVAEASPDHTLRVEVEGAVVGNWDAFRLERVLANLLSNAVKYSPHGGEIVVTLRREGPNAMLSVADQGLGIPEEDLPFIFERFARAGNVPDEVSGTGVGLAGVRQIVRQHNGDVTVESVPGHGSIFHVTLPTER